MSTKTYVQRLASARNPLWKGRGPILHWLDIELTERCNLNCVHCSINLPADDIRAREKELSTDSVKDVLRQAASLGCLTVRLTGGEPLLREDFEEIYITARKLGLKVLLFTNAVLLTPGLADLFVRIPPLEKIEVSVYGMRARSYEAVTRTPGSFPAARKGIGLLVGKKIPFLVKTALLPPNKDEMEEFEIWASALTGADGPPQWAMLFDLRSRRDSEVKNRLIKGLRPSPDEALRIMASRRDEYAAEMGRQCSRDSASEEDRLFSCGAGAGTAAVDAYGRVQPCLNLRHPKSVFDLNKGSLREAMTGFFPELRRARAENPEFLEKCASCFMKWLCEQCPAKSWAEHGTLDTPAEYFCGVAQAQARFLGLLGVGEKPWDVKDGGERILLFSGGR